MAGEWTALGCDNPQRAPDNFPSRAAALLRLRRVRILLFICVMLVVVQLTLTPFSTKVQDYSPQDVYQKLKNSTAQLGKSVEEEEGTGKSTWGESTGSMQVEPLEKSTSVTTASPSVVDTTPSAVASSILTAIPSPTSSTQVQDEIDWSSYAYVQYVTNSIYLCNSLLIFEALHRLGTKADLAMLYPREWKVPNSEVFAESPDSAQLAKARDEYGVKLVPIKVQHLDHGERTWQDSLTKLLLFNQTQYKRVIHLDSDGTVLKSMDELFLLPSTACAMPRGYWINPATLTSAVIVAEPSTAEFKRIIDFATHGDAGYDMEILNSIYSNSALIIPHRNYLLLSGEFRANTHEKYLGNDYEAWNATKELEDVKYVHWSEWPLPKPWIRPDEHELEVVQPKCKDIEGGNGEEEMEMEGDCRDRDAYFWLREDFTRRRKEICGREFDSRRKRT